MTTTTWGPNGQDVYERTYSRIKADGSNEVWNETVTRVVEGNLALVSQEHHLEDEAKNLKHLLLNMKAIPAGRHLWVTGVDGRQFNRNCHRAGWGPELSDHFTFTFGELMKGGGVGANYSSSYLEDLPLLANWPSVKFVCNPEHPDFHEFEQLIDEDMNVFVTGSKTHRIEGWFTVPDTREGWVEAMGLLIDSHTLTYQSSLVLDVSQVRPRGTPLKTFGGVASGPGPLLSALSEANRILADADEVMTPLEAMSIDHAIASCVVAGNIRRSARMSILHWQDPFIWDFINCKTDHQSHWSTNISVEVDDEFFDALSSGDTWAERVFSLVSEGMLRNGEPGFYNSSLAAVGEHSDVRATNPCGEITLNEWEACTLGHINLAAFPPWKERNEVADAFRLMARFLVRATFADITDERQREVENQNRRIGVGIFGFQEWAGVRGVRYSEIHKSPWLAKELEFYYQVVREAASKYANELGIPAPVKFTTVAPTGTIAKLPGTTEGIHPIYARFFERRIRYAENDPKLVEIARRGLAIEDCVYSADTKVVVHHVMDPIMTHIHNDLVEQSDEIDVKALAATQAFVQEHYADNAVSFTMNVSEDLSLGRLEDTLMEYLPKLKGTTVMVDASRPQSPYTRITEDDYVRATDHQIGQSEMDCAGAACPIR